MADSTLSEGSVYGMGNPLLDISALVEEDLLQKYELKANDAILAAEKHLPIYKELQDKYKVEYLPGGATQNTIRIIQWLSQIPKFTSYIGCIGNDEYGKKLTEIVSNEGVVAHYMKTDKEPTGTCAVLVTGKDRSLVANIAAANCYEVEHLNSPENWSLIEKAKLYYIAGFFLTVSVDSILTVAKHAALNNKPFCINLAAPFISQFYSEQLNQVLVYVDYLFGNDTEYLAFAENAGWGKELSFKQIALKTAALPKTADSKRDRCVILTQGPEPAIIAYKGEIMEYPIPPLKQEDILDSNSAGDSFVGGFLYQLVQDKSFEDCINCSCYAAQTVLAHPGCTFPAKPSFSL